MNIRQTAAGYLQKGGSAWSDCYPTGAISSDTDLSDSVYLYIGKRYWVSAGPATNYRSWRSFLRFVIPAYAASESIKSAKIVLNVETDGSATDFTILVSKLTTSFADNGGVEGYDWVKTGTLAATAGTDGIKTGSATYKVLELPFSATGVALLSAGSFDFMLVGSDVSTEPTGDEYIRCYTGNATAARKPYLVVLMSDARELIVEGVVTALGVIDALTPPYNTTPVTISDVWQDLSRLREPEFPAIFVHEAEDAYQDGQESVGGNQVRMFKIMLVAGVFEKTRAELRPSIFRLLADIRHVIEAQRTATPKLALSGIEVTDLNILSLKTTEDYLIDDNRAFGLAEVGVSYLRTMNES